jgi:hypothetical protein
MRVIRRYKGSELPDVSITRYQPDGQLYQFATGWTFTVRIGVPGQAALVTPTATGANTAPNILVTFAPNALDSITQGTYHLEVTPRFTGTSKDLDSDVILFQVLEGVAA